MRGAAQEYLLFFSDLENDYCRNFYPNAYKEEELDISQHKRL